MCNSDNQLPTSSKKRKKKQYNDSKRWMDWYWNKGGREKVQARRKIAEYNRYQKDLSNEQKSV